MGKANQKGGGKNKRTTGWIHKIIWLGEGLGGKRLGVNRLVQDLKAKVKKQG